ncbi:high mobility group box domain-containing protein, partial [Delphinella strobiligena]
LHPTMVAQNPGLHNNEISKIIGKMWRDEPESVKNEWKNKSENVKRQHLKDHPGYQYQPRKPSEKKRRMTKRKAASLAAQAAS